MDGLKIDEYAACPIAMFAISDLISCYMQNRFIMDGHLAYCKDNLCRSFRKGSHAGTAKAFLKFFAVFFFAASLLLSGGAILAAQGIGSDAAYPIVAACLETFPFQRGQLYRCSLGDLRVIMDLAAEIKINVFEVIDCFYRWCEPKGIRIVIYGNDLRQIEKEYNLGGKRVLAILALENLARLEAGAILAPSQYALDMHLTKPYEQYIEIGTAIYEKRAGFKKVAPKLFDEAYGISVKRFFVKTEFLKLELFEPGKGAIYVKVVPIPKRWNLDIIKKK